jgi:hypothetical protein
MSSAETGHTKEKEFLMTHPSTVPAPEGSAGKTGAPAASAPSEPKTPNADGGLTLLVSNQSFADDPVRITISIDGDVVVDDEFSVGMQDNWIAFEVRLPPGNHELTMRSSTGVEADAEVSIPAAGHRWASAAYWNSPPDPGRARADKMPRRFSLTVNDEPIALA